MSDDNNKEESELFEKMHHQVEIISQISGLMLALLIPIFLANLKISGRDWWYVFMDGGFFFIAYVFIRSTSFLSRSQLRKESLSMYIRNVNNLRVTIIVGVNLICIPVIVLIFEVDVYAFIFLGILIGVQLYLRFKSKKEHLNLLDHRKKKLERRSESTSDFLE
jgi:hypothetical protein